MSDRQCVVCKAAVHNLNPKGNTCDSTCTRARDAKRTREQQILVDIRESEHRANERDEYSGEDDHHIAPDSLSASLRHCDGDDYNRPG